MELERINTGFIKDIGIEIEYMENGKAIGSLKIEEKHLNPFKMVHGGVFFSLADTVAGCAANSMGAETNTLTSSIDYMRPGKDTSKIICEAFVEKSGKHIVWIEADIYNDEHILLCKYKGIYYCVQKM